MNKFWILIACCAGLAGCSKSGPAAAGPGHESESNIVEMEAAAQSHAGVAVAPARLGRLAEHLQVTGTVQPASSRVAEVRPPARGRILEVLVKVGDRVRAGQALARFDNIEAGELVAQLASDRSGLERLKIQLAAQSRQTERIGSLVEIGAAPRKDYEQSRAEQEALEQSVRSQESAIASLVSRLDRFGVAQRTPGGPVVAAIPAPFAGVVTRAEAAPGEMVDFGAELFRIVDLSQVWVQAEVYEKDLGRVRAGQAARILVDTYPGEPFVGKVTYISDVLDPQTRTAKVRCEAPNPGYRLKLDMFATIQLPTTFSRVAIAVPSTAVQQLEGKNVVFVQRGATKFEIREIKTGRTVDGSVEVVAGLREGEPVVIQGAFHMKSIAAGKGLAEE